MSRGTLGGDTAPPKGREAGTNLRSGSGSPRWSLAMPFVISLLILSTFVCRPMGSRSGSQARENHGLDAQDQEDEE